MSINKFALSLALAGILGATVAVAETSGAFVGVQGNTNFSSNTFKRESNGGSCKNTDTQYQIGVLGGYKFFFMPEVGVRAYGVLNYQNSQSKYDDGKATNNILSASANVDGLYNFVSSESLDFGVFAGLSLGYTKITNKDESDGEPSSKITMSGFDPGINFGLRANVAQNHGLELYSRFGLADIKKTENGVTQKFRTPYTVGLRYAYSL